VAQEDIENVLERFSQWEAGDEVAACYREAGSSGGRRAVSGPKSNETKRGKITSVGENGSRVVDFFGATHVIPCAWVEEKVLRVFPCPATACLGGANFTCKDGHLGSACGQCNDTVSANGTFFTTNGVACVECTENLEGAIAAMAGVAVAVVVFLATAVWPPLVDLGRWMPAGTAEIALGHTTVLQVNPKPETRKMTPPKPEC
jgi:hypothetical protein